MSEPVKDTCRFQSFGCLPSVDSASEYLVIMESVCHMKLAPTRAQSVEQVVRVRQIGPTSESSIYRVHRLQFGFLPVVS